MPPDSATTTRESGNRRQRRHEKAPNRPFPERSNRTTSQSEREPQRKEQRDSSKQNVCLPEKAESDTGQERPTRVARKVRCRTARCEDNGKGSSEKESAVEEGMRGQRKKKRSPSVDLRWWWCWRAGVAHAGFSSQTPRLARTTTLGLSARLGARAPTLCRGD